MAVKPILRVEVPTYEEREQPQPHIVYKIHVESLKDSWDVYRRYSEFVTLHATISPPMPPAPLPPKNLLKRSWKLVREVGGLFPSNPEQDSLDYDAIEQRREALEFYLRAILAARDDQWRSNWALIRFLGAENRNQKDSGTTEEQKHQANTSTKSRSAISSTSLSRPSATRSHPTELRPWASRPQAVETEQTRPLSDAELLQRQTNTLMRDQDVQAEQLAKILQRQRQLGIAIHDEVAEQAELLTSLDSAVSDTRNNLDTAQTQLKRFE
ncbi:hypothetical protein MYAM1_001618 [Malassezia yamatoensis]|uniref:Uncharacterized protein n=1 Tax=Malassezia yamatoensis TaxID=253288 RepID=A0AAJ5YTB9_9BASI|nr:hypothetical protein MYAM1_001618 [Malassezia yamatoensis]